MKLEIRLLQADTLSLLLTNSLTVCRDRVNYGRKSYNFTIGQNFYIKDGTAMADIEGHIYHLGDGAAFQVGVAFSFYHELYPIHLTHVQPGSSLDETTVVGWLVILAFT